MGKICQGGEGEVDDMVLWYLLKTRFEGREAVRSSVSWAGLPLTQSPPKPLVRNAEPGRYHPTHSGQCDCIFQ